ncbi:MAG TPA: DUF2461 domain-containing protein [Cytophagaceae bacterium]|jgi:uncharacterized protein (TIGR02453 family)
METKQILDFLKKLQKNNNKEWFEKNRDTYEAIKSQLKEFATALIESINQFDPSLGPLESKDCLFRINRDVRFSNNKSPYKTNVGMYLARGGKKSKYAGYYLHLQPGNESFIAGGLYVPEAEDLKRVRDEIDYDAADLLKILKSKAFVKYFSEINGDKLKNPPKGYAKDHPNIELLKHKSFVMFHRLSDDQLLSKDLSKYCPEVFKQMTPLNSYFNRALDGDL